MKPINDVFFQICCDKAAAKFRVISHTEYYYSEIVRDASHMIIRNFFSKDWLIRHFYQGLEVDENYITESTFASMRSDWKRYVLTFHRLRTLAECLFNFQDVEGFSAQLRDFINNSRSGLPHSFKSGYAELLAARYIFLADAPFRFVARTGKSKNDFDIEVVINDQKVAVEVKAKVNGNNFDKKSFFDVIDKAVSQSDNQSEKLVFVNVPEEWSEHPEFHRLISINDDVTSRLRSAQLVFFWEKELNPNDRGVYYKSFLKPFNNPLMAHIVGNPESNLKFRKVVDFAVPSMMNIFHEHDGR